MTVFEIYPVVFQVLEAFLKIVKAVHFGVFSFGEASLLPFGLWCGCFWVIFEQEELFSNLLVGLLLLIDINLIFKRLTYGLDFTQFLLNLSEFIRLVFKLDIQIVNLFKQLGHLQIFFKDQLFVLLFLMEDIRLIIFVEAVGDDLLHHLYLSFPDHQLLLILGLLLVKLLPLPIKAFEQLFHLNLIGLNLMAVLHGLNGSFILSNGEHKRFILEACLVRWGWRLSVILPFMDFGDHVADVLVVAHADGLLVGILNLGDFDLELLDGLASACLLGWLLFLLQLSFQSEVIIAMVLLIHTKFLKLDDVGFANRLITFRFFLI